MTHELYTFYDIDTCGSCRGFGEVDRYPCKKCQGQGCVESVGWSCACGEKGDGDTPELCPKEDDQ